MASPASIETSPLGRVLRSYDVANQADVEAFVESRPWLVPILAQAPTQIASAFGRSPRLRLEVYRDPDAPEPAELHIVVITQMSTEAEWDAADASVRCVHANWLIHLPRAETRDLFIRPEPR